MRRKVDKKNIQAEPALQIKPSLNQIYPNSFTMRKRIRDYLNRNYLPRKIVLAADLFIATAALLPAYLLRFNFSTNGIILAEVLFQQVFYILPIYLIAFLWSGSYRGIIRHSGIYDASRFAIAISIATLANITLEASLRQFAFFYQFIIPYSVIIIHAALISILLMGFRMMIRSLYYNFGSIRANYRLVFIFGAGEMGKITRGVLENDHIARTKVAGFIDDDTHLIGKRLADKIIYSEDQAFAKIQKDKNIREIVFAISPDQIKNSRKKALADRCLKNGINIKEVPPVKNWINGQLNSKQIRKIQIEDLLGRDPIQLNQEQVSCGLKGAVVLVTGAAGSIGSEIGRQLMCFDCKRVILLDQAESALYDLQNELLVNYPKENFEVVVASVTDNRHLRQVFEKYRPQFVFNAAAYKHVPLMETFPYEAIRVNVGGTRILADLSCEFCVEKFVMISTDKAVNPTNVMGASKRICEIYIHSLAQANQTKTQFITTRFGNVLGSNGSVVPLFRRQIEAGGPVTITHRDIIRYFMTISEACQLVLEAGFMGLGGEIYMFDMGEPIQIYDLAVKMITLAGLKPETDIPIQITSLRPGEKLFEELLANEENTIPTHHPKIKAAKVREHFFGEVKLAVDALLKATQTETDAELVRRMKALVPEYISQNSEYCMFDEPTVEKRISENKHQKMFSLNFNKPDQR